MRRFDKLTAGEAEILTESFDFVGILDESLGSTSSPQVIFIVEPHFSQMRGSTLKTSFTCLAVALAKADASGPILRGLPFRQRSIDGFDELTIKLLEVILEQLLESFFSAFLAASSGTIHSEEPG